MALEGDCYHLNLVMSTYWHIWSKRLHRPKLSYSHNIRCFWLHCSILLPYDHKLAHWTGWSTITTLSSTFPDHRNPTTCWRWWLVSAVWYTWLLADLHENTHLFCQCFQEWLVRQVRTTKFASVLNWVIWYRRFHVKALHYHYGSDDIPPSGGKISDGRHYGCFC